MACVIAGFCSDIQDGQNGSMIAVGLELAGGRTDPALLQKFCRSVEAEGCADPPEFPGLFARWSELEATNETFRDAARNASRSYRDSRVRAVFAIAPAIGPTLTPASLKRIAVPVAIVAGTDDLLVPPRSNAELLARLTPRASLTLLHSVGHYTFLATCTEEGRRVQQQLCADVAGVDREEVHRRTVENAVQFFDGTFK
jgi:predicted dienelactone hydrolase